MINIKLPKLNNFLERLQKSGESKDINRYSKISYK